MTSHSILVAGLPESGKTTFLAALWHTVSSQEIPTELRLHALKTGNFAHLNEIARKWCEVLDQERTKTGQHEIVSMELTADGTESIQMTFPDLSGEDFRDMWERRDCAAEFTVAAADSPHVLFFVHADRVIAPRWVIDEAALLERLGLPAGSQPPVDWSPRMSPTQVQVVDILQLLRNPPFSTGPGKLAIVFSAWDKARNNQLTPAEFLEHRLPLLSQYLEANSDHWTCGVFGVSAIGGDITPTNPNDMARASAVVQELREVDLPCERIEVVGPAPTTHDLTTILTWLLG